METREDTPAVSQEPHETAKGGDQKVVTEVVYTERGKTVRASASGSSRRTWAKRENAHHKEGLLILSPQAIHDYQAKRGMTQIELADALGINRSHFNRLVLSKAKTSMPLLMRIAEFIGAAWYELILPADKEVVDKEDAEFLRLYKNMLAKPPMKDDR